MALKTNSVGNLFLFLYNIFLGVLEIKRRSATFEDSVYLAT